MAIYYQKETPSNDQWLKDGTAYARWEKAQTQCTWCKKVGNYYYDNHEMHDTQAYYNWKVTALKEPGTIVCNVCLKRESPPHVEYLRKLDQLEKKCFQTLGEQLYTIAEFAYEDYHRFSPQRIRETQSSPLSNNEFPAGRKIDYREQTRRSDYRDMTIGETLNFLHTWIFRTCPTCARNNRYRDTRFGKPPLTFHSWCCHHKPSMQLRGDRGITVSFDKSSPSLRSLGLRPTQLHAGLRSIAEIAYDIDMNRQESLFLEMDMGSARTAAGYGVDDSDSEEEAFLERRRHAMRSFPLRDIHCEFEMTTIARTWAENQTRRRHLILSNHQGPIENGDMDAINVRNDCQNCGTHVMITAFIRYVDDLNAVHDLRDGNHHMLCTKCNGGMCRTCAHKSEDPMVPICFPCQFRWRQDWVIVKSTWRNDDGRACLHALFDKTCQWCNANRGYYP